MKERAAGVSAYPTPRAKRWMDLVLAVLALAVLWPIWVLACLLVRLDSPGPILLRQRRVGKDGRLFTFYKFRTLAWGEEDDLNDRLPRGDLSRQLLSPPGPNPRAGAIGRVLRATTVDELPQLLNVVRGDMSLVGPRPDLPEIVARWPPHYLERHRVRPGMTGLAQVNGRSDLTYEEKIRYDLDYVRYHPLRRDMEILWRTLWLVLSKRGAR